MLSSSINSKGNQLNNTADTKNTFSLTHRGRFTLKKQDGSEEVNQSMNKPKTARIQSFSLTNNTAFDHRSRTPSPSLAEPDRKVQLKKGYSFGHNKKINFNDSEPKYLPTRPMPTKYEKTFFGKTCSFVYRQKFFDPLARQKLKLGPGQYEIADLLNKKGQYPQSKHRSACCRKIGRQKRFGSDETASPGPAKYNDQLSLDPIGNYFNSRIPSKGIKTFGNPKTVSIFPVNGNPGPSTLHHFPDFPNYLSR